MLWYKVSISIGGKGKRRVYGDGKRGMRKVRREKITTIRPLKRKSEERKEESREEVATKNKKMEEEEETRTVNEYMLSQY